MVLLGRLPCAVVVDYSWVKLNPEMIARTNRWMYRVLASAGVVWLTLMAGLFALYGSH